MGKGGTLLSTENNPTKQKTALFFQFASSSSWNEVGLEKQLQILLAHSVGLLGANNTVFIAHK